MTILEKIELQDGFHSTLSVEKKFKIDIFLKRKNLKLLKSYSTLSEQKINYKELFFKTTAGFYLYLLKDEQTDLFTLEIYHKEEHLNEIQIFLKQIEK